MVFPSGRIQFPIINAYSPPRLNPCGNELILVVFNNSDSSLFRNDLDETHPLTIRNGINNVMILPLLDFFLHYFLKGVVQPSLSIPVGLSIILKMNAMLHDSRTNASNVP